ncbi:MAG: hypothetical protein ACK5LH_00945 [Akkermansiaceae bacterium]|jgi:hypothetical protein
MKLKTVIVGSGSKGGSGKTFALVILAFVLRRLGYRIHLIDADTSNRTFSKAHPEEDKSGELVKVDLDKEGDFQKALEACAYLDDDVITIIDMPGSRTDFFVDFFGKRKPQDFEKVGLRLIFAITVSNTAVALQGIREILKICMADYPVIALKTNMANLKGTQFNLEDSNTGTALKNIAKGRVIEIKQLGGLQCQEYDRLPAPPSEFEMGGRAATKLGLTHLSSMEWVAYGKQAVDNVLPNAEWLTALPIPNPPIATKSKVDPYLNNIIDRMTDDDL